MASAECEIVQLIYSNECVCTYTITCFAHLCICIIPMEPWAIKIRMEACQNTHAITCPALFVTILCDEAHAFGKQMCILHKIKA